MADSTKRNRNFDFSKPKDRHFDFTKDQVDDVVDEPQKSQLKENERKPHLWLLLLIVVAIIIAFACFKGCNKTETVTEEFVTHETSKSSITSEIEEKQLETEENETESFSDVVPVEALKDPDMDKSQTGNTCISNIDDEDVDTKVQENLSEIETNARRVIRGDFGNGKVRKNKLGSSYTEIQNRVNEIYRQGKQ